MFELGSRAGPMSDQRRTRAGSARLTVPVPSLSFDVFEREVEMSRGNRTKFRTEQERSGWKEILDWLVNSQLARSVSSGNIRSEAQADGLNHIAELQQMADAIPGNIPGKPLDRSTLDAGSSNTRSKVFALYKIQSPHCLKAIENEDASAFGKAYEEQHNSHVLDIKPNTGQYAPGAGGKRAEALAARVTSEGTAGTPHTAAAPVGAPLALEDRDDTEKPVSRTLGNVSIVEVFQSKNFVVGADGYLSAFVRCHAAKWGGLAVAATSVTLTLVPKRRPKRSINPPPLKDVVLFNGHRDRIIVERLDRYTVRVRAVADPDKKVRPIGEIDLPGALWVILDMQVGDEFECEMCVLLRDVNAERQPDEPDPLIAPRGDPLDDTMMLKLEKRFEEARRIGRDQDDNRVALLHKPCVALALSTKKV